jgi:hypothetical protein
LIFFPHINRTVDSDKPEESPSDSDSAESDLQVNTSRTIKTKTVTASDLYFSCKIDRVSEAQIVDAVRGINYSIANLIINILHEVKKSKLSYPSHKSKAPPRKHPSSIIIPTKPDPGFTLLRFLLVSRDRLSDDSRESVVEFILHNLILSLVHKHFFKGGHFFGVGSETLYEDLETMFSKLVAGGKYFFLKSVFFF